MCHISKNIFDVTTRFFFFFSLSTLVNRLNDFFDNKTTTKQQQNNNKTTTKQQQNNNKTTTKQQTMEWSSQSLELGVGGCTNTKAISITFVPVGPVIMRPSPKTHIFLLFLLLPLMLSPLLSSVLPFFFLLLFLPAKPKHYLFFRCCILFDVCLDQSL